MTFSRRDFLKTGLTFGALGAAGASGLLTGCGSGGGVHDVNDMCIM